MQRRSFLASGLGAVAGASLTAGCIQQSSNDAPERPPNGSSGRQPGLAPNERDVPAPDADPSTFERITVDGTEVPLVPIDVAHPWYLRQEARFVDARKSISAYESSHVAGAVFSPAPSGYDENDPTNAWSKSERIITYCTCPHHYSSQRAASLIEAGYENVYALDEGFGEWYDRDYPMRSSNGAVTLGERREVTGTVDARYASKQVEIQHRPTGQREPGRIAADGSFRVTFRFAQIDTNSTIVLVTPAWTRTGTVAELTSDSVTTDGSTSRRA